jgi:voltage-gated potassium channel
VQREPVVMVLGEGRWRWAYEGVMVALALLVVGLLFLDNAGWVPAVNLGIWGVFVLDYVVRLGLSTDRKRFFRANIVDFLAIMPADFFRALRVLRLARLLRVVRAVTVVGRILRDVRGVTRTNGLRWVLLVAAGSILLGGLVAWAAEPTMTTFEDALWWAVVTATTVGYGDLSPESGLVRVVAVLLMVFGIGTIGMLTGSIATYFIDEGEAADQAADPDVEHVRQRLSSWSELSRDQRSQLASLLDVAARSGDEAASSPRA